MTVRHCRNATTRTNKRHVRTNMLEVRATSGSTFNGENHPNLVTFVDIPGTTSFFYPGREHLPVGVKQYDLNDI